MKICFRVNQQNPLRFTCVKC